MLAPQPRVIDLLEWIAAEPPEYGAVMDAWLTGRLRLSVWEDAVDGGLVEPVTAGPKACVPLTDARCNLLSRKRS